MEKSELAGGMEMDISAAAANAGFSLRAAALIIIDNRLLVIKNAKYGCFYTIGGGIEINETSVDAVIRETLEETGHCFRVDRLAFVQERFYSANHMQHHEVVFFYLMKPADVDIEDGTCTDQKEEKLYWLPIDALQSYNLIPAFLRTALASVPDTVSHVITRE